MSHMRPPLGGPAQPGVAVGSRRGRIPVDWRWCQLVPGL